MGDYCSDSVSCCHARLKDTKCFFLGDRSVTCTIIFNRKQDYGCEPGKATRLRQQIQAVDFVSLGSGLLPGSGPHPNSFLTQKAGWLQAHRWVSAALRGRRRMLRKAARLCLVCGKQVAATMACAWFRGRQEHSNCMRD